MNFIFLIYFLFIGVFYFKVEQFIKGIMDFFFWSVLGLCFYAGFPLISVNRGLLLFFGVHGLLIVMASLVAEHGL